MNYYNKYYLINILIKGNVSLLNISLSYKINLIIYYKFNISLK
jgi:hypothetical protein